MDSPGVSKCTRVDSWSESSAGATSLDKCRCVQHEVDTCGTLERIKCGCSQPGKVEVPSAGA
eukprot:7102435-Lingulodinium_polyedra.AAC.1